MPNWEIHWKDYYKILQVHPAAEQEVIEAAAYRRLARKYHPDVNPSADSARRMQYLNEAYEILGDIEKRRVYHPVYLEYKRTLEASNSERSTNRC